MIKSKAVFYIFLSKTLRPTNPTNPYTYLKLFLYEIRGNALFFLFIYFQNAMNVLVKIF